MIYVVGAYSDCRRWAISAGLPTGNGCPDVTYLTNHLSLRTLSLSRTRDTAVVLPSASEDMLAILPSRWRGR